MALKGQALTQFSALTLWTQGVGISAAPTSARERPTTSPDLAGDRQEIASRPSRDSLSSTVACRRRIRGLLRGPDLGATELAGVGRRATRHSLSIRSALG